MLFCKDLIFSYKDQNDIEKYKKQIENLKKEKNKYVSFCAKGIITETELKNFVNELEPNILFLIREIKTLEEIIGKQKNYRRKGKQFKSPPNCFGEHGGLRQG